MGSPHLLPLLLSILLPGAVLAGQSKGGSHKNPQKPRPVHCTFCKHKGGKPCKGHKKRILAMEQKVLVCSVAVACERCGGGLWIDCKRCVNPATEALAAKRLKAAQWLQQRRKKVDARLPDREILHARTKNVHMSFSIQPLKFGRRKISTHQLMHLYLERVEALRADFVKTLELSDKDLKAPIDLFMFRNMASHRTIGPHVTGGGSARGSGEKLMGVDMVYSMYFNHEKLKSDEDLHRNIVHNVTHLLVNHMGSQQWIYDKKCGWLDAGLAHWFEYRVSQRCVNFCFEEVSLDYGQGYKGGKWRVAVRKLVDAKKAPSLTTFYAKNTDQLGLAEHALAFAYVDYLIEAYGGAKMRDLLKAAKKRIPSIEALRSVYDRSPFQIDEEFRAHVKKRYPKR